MAKTKEISRRLKSIASTKKITKAMEMVSAAKMRKAIEAVLRSRAYAKLSWETVLRLADMNKNKSDELHPLLVKRGDVKRLAVVLIASNRGLCGGFNTALVAKVRQAIRRYQVETDLIILGKKGLPAAIGHKLAAEFIKTDLVQNISEISPLAQMATSDYLSGKYDKILLAYTDFVSPAKQVPRVKQLLPLDVREADSQLGVVENQGMTPEKEFSSLNEEKKAHGADFISEYLFEPDPASVLDKMVPKLIEIQLYQALLESNASEHSARMSAMHQATEAATDMAAELNLSYNKARQAGITSEIAEISAGANALAE
jgi:F-type H+-transporting ATPase subunit gamma